MKRGLTGYIFPFILLVAALFLMLRFGGGPAPMPQAFKGTLCLEDATTAATDQDKPVLVFATADWCGPCQRLKRTTLADERLNELIRDRTVPVYLDLTQAQNDAELAGHAQQLGVQSLPSFVLLRNGQVVSRQGPMTTAQMIDWIDTH